MAVRVGIAVGNTTTDAFDMALHRFTGTHEPDLDRVANSNTGQLGFFEISLNIKSRIIDQGHHRLPGIDIVAFSQAQVGDMAIARCLELTAGQVDGRRLDIGLGLVHHGPLRH
ncbi:hypothetical protein D3C77_588500 [compost metagenome]